MKTSKRPRTKAIDARPVALLTRLPRSPLPQAPCYAVRTDQAREKPHVDALPDEDMPELDAPMLRAIDEWTSGQDVYPLVYTDDELIHIETVQFNFAYKPLVDAGALARALEADGYEVVELGPAPAAREVEWGSLGRHLAMTSLDAVLTRVLDNRPLLFHGQAVASSLAPLLGAPALGLGSRATHKKAAALKASAEAWSPPMVHAFYALVRETAANRWIAEDPRSSAWAAALGRDVLGALPQAAVREAARAYRERVLAHREPAMRHVLALAELDEPLDPRRLRVAATRAAARSDTSLREWGRARRLLDAKTFARGATQALDFAVPMDFQDLAGFIATARAVASVDPDLCLRALTKLASHLGAGELRRRAAELDAALPVKGFSPEALAVTSLQLSAPRLRRSANVLASLLSRRGIVPRSVPPPRLDEIDATCSVATDVAHLVLGDPDAISAVRAADPEDWAVILRRDACVGVVTGADGRFQVRVVGTAGETKPRLEAGAHVGTFPLRIKNGALAVSGIVGAGSATIAFPNGSFAADVFWTGKSVRVVVAATASAPKWKWGEELPWLPIDSPRRAKARRPRSAPRR